MILVAISRLKSSALYGLLLKKDRESGMVQVALDKTDNNHFSVGWIRLNSSCKMSSDKHIWNHPAMNLIESGKIDEGIAMYWKEEATRKEERLRKERAA